jgi:hypothetical protein
MYGTSKGNLVWVEVLPTGAPKDILRAVAEYVNNGVGDVQHFRILCQIYDLS